MFYKLTDRIYFRPQDGYTDRPNIGLILGDRRTLMFDAGNSAANVESLKRELAEQGLPEPDYVAVSHWHWDHSFGMCGWDVPTIACRMTNDKLRQVQGWAWDDASMDARVERKEDIVFCNEMIRREYPDRSQICVAAADIVFEGRITLDLGGITCDLIRAAGPHTADGVICHIPSEKFVFLGDGNSRDLYGHPWHFDIAHEEDMVTEMMKIPYDRELVEPYVRLLDGLDFTRCIGGHADVMTKQELFDSFG